MTTTSFDLIGGNNSLSKARLPGQEMMMRTMMLVAASLGLLAATPTVAAPCKDAKTGKFVKCPDKAAAKPARCKDVKGKFAKCGAPGAKPA